MSDAPVITNSELLRRRANTVIPGGANTLSKRPENFALGAMPSFIERGQGCRVWDVDGNEFIDYIGSLGPVTLGYCYPAVDKAIADQLSRGILFPFSSPLEVEVAEALCEVLPGADWVRFLKTGAEATAAAVRVARAATGRDIILNSGYHGWHDLWTAERGAPSDRGVPSGMKDHVVGFDLVPPLGKPAIDPARALAAVLDAHRGRVAAVVMEPVSYYNLDVGGALAEARRLADEHGALLIFDEIVSGFRLARGGASEKYDIIPDMATWAKGMANGMPLAALTGRGDLAALVAQLVISSTYSGEILSLAASKACLKVYAENDVIGHAISMGERLLSGLREAADEANLKMIFGGHAMMSGYVFTYADQALNRDLTTLFIQEMAARGILIRRNGLLFISYSHSAEQIDKTIEAAASAVAFIKQAAESGNAKQWLRTVEPDNPIPVGLQVR